MPYINYFNKTASLLDGSWNVYLVLFLGDLALIVVSFFYILFILYLNNKLNQYHYNMRRIIFVFYFQYAIHLIFVFFQVNYTIFGFIDDSNPQLSTAFVLLSYGRSICTFMALHGLPIHIIERCFATYYIHDYEVWKRKNISAFCISLMTLIGVIMALSYHFVNTVIFHVIICVLNNGSAFVINLLLYWLNLRYYHRSLNQANGYSLAEKFQICENIKTLQLFTRTLFSMTAFNFLGAACISVHEFDFDMGYQNMAVLGFDYAALCYGFVVPFVTWLHSDMWRHETREKLRVIRRNWIWGRKETTVGPIDTGIVDLRNTFGEQMTVDVNAEANLHFDMLKAQWNKAQ